jgi:hypothetical protein
MPKKTLIPPRTAYIYIFILLKEASVQCPICQLIPITMRVSERTDRRTDGWTDNGLDGTDNGLDGTDKLCVPAHLSSDLRVCVDGVKTECVALVGMDMKIANRNRVFENE